MIKIMLVVRRVAYTITISIYEQKTHESVIGRPITYVGYRENDRIIKTVVISPGPRL